MPVPFYKKRINMGLLEDTLNRICPLSSETEEEIRTRWNRLLFRDLT